jgi:exopolyphosphatase / guanosine-5'-triphosphate,3'-diphosphate pyrophosphatase
VTVTTRAVIDVGTNSVKLLIADVGADTIRPILEQSEHTRLGRGFYESHQLRPDAMSQTATAVARFAETARREGASAIRIIATSAARDAVNRVELTEAIESCCGLKTQVISGEDEAELVFRGVITDPKFQGRRLMILDVGGGSSEIILGEGEHHEFRQSVDLGSVRLLEKLKPADPPSADDLRNCRAFLKDFFNRQIDPNTEATVRGKADLTLVGTGGTMTILARMEKRMIGFDREEIEGTSIDRDRIGLWMEQVWRLPLADRKQIPGIPANRADILPMGVAIYEAVMDHFGLATLFVSTRGLRFGALLT